MNLSQLAVRYRPIVITGVTLLTLWGVYSYFTMPRREDPEYTVRTCAITTTWPGAPAEKVEELITKPIEEIVDRIDEVDIVRSTTKVGLSTVYVDAEEFVPASQIDNVWDKVRARIKRVVMPEDGIEPDVNDEYGDTYIILFAVSQDPDSLKNDADKGREYTLRELDQISEKIKDELRLLPGVAKSEQYGVVEEAIYVETDLGVWSQIGLTIDDLASLTQVRNIVAAGGTIDTDVGRFSVKPGGELNSVDELESIVAGMVATDGQANPAYLKDIGLKIVRDYQDPPQRICRNSDTQSSNPAVIVAISMKPGANIVTICDLAKAKVAELQAAGGIIPSDIKVTPISDQSENVKAKISQVFSNVVGAIIIVVIVVYLVVGFRSAAVMAANIPIVVLGAIAIITLFGVQLEQISLASIIIALGLLVDNAVQVCDQARTNQIAGMKPVDAAVAGASQVASPMLMGTATTVAAFAPMLVGLIGSKKEYIYSMPVTLSVTLGISWVLAMTFCTILAGAIIRAPKNPDKPSAPLPILMSWLQRAFTSSKKTASAEQPDLVDRLFRFFVRTAIDHKFITIGVSVALMIAAIKLPVGSEFFPKDVRDQFAVKIWLPDNATIEQTNKVALQVEENLRKLSPTTTETGESVQRIRAMRTIVGGGGSRWYLSWDPESQRSNFAEILVRTTDGRLTPGFAKDLREACEKGNKELGIEPVVGARIVPIELFLGPSSDPVEIRVIGPGFANMQQLRNAADEVRDLVRHHPGTWDVNDSWGVSGYELRIDADEDKANLAGVSNAAIAQTLNAYFSGHHLTTFREGDHLVPVYLRLSPDQRGELTGLESAFVEGAKDKIPLSSIATISPRWEPATIIRRDLNRVIEVRSQVEPGVRGNDVVNEIMASAEMKQLQAELPAGFYIEVGGSLEDSAEGAEQLGMCLGISILTIILLLVIQYNGWAKPFVILSTLPMALIGALPGLYFTGNPLGFMPQLGILSLFGIVLNTGIIFIEFADILIKQAAEKSDGTGPVCGLSVDEFRSCLVDAGKQRLLPIFLTTATTIGGLLPLAISGGPLWEGMAWCMIFGLAIATVLTLIVVPALYAFMVEVFKVKPVAID